jgi:uncharacterized phiE125 gp8 family phage protein
MSLALITAPTVDVVSLVDMTAHLRVDASDDDVLIAGLVAAVAGTLDPATGGWLGRALRPQTWELRLDGFPCEEIALPYPPLIAITSVKYDDTGGTERTLAPATGYRILNAGGLGKTILAPPYGTSWPVARADRETVRIRYQCGYPPTPAPDPLPAAIAAWIKLHVGKLYEQREAVIVGAPVAVLPEIDGLIWPYRVF